MDELRLIFSYSQVVLPVVLHEWSGTYAVGRIIVVNSQNIS